MAEGTTTMPEQCCPECEYSLEGIDSPRCPECGVNIAEAVEAMLRRHRRFRRGSLVSAWVNAVLAGLVAVWLLGLLIVDPDSWASGGWVADFVTTLLVIVVINAVPSISCLLVFASRNNKGAAAREAMAMGRFLAWVWVPLVLTQVVVLIPQLAQLNWLYENWFAVCLALIVLWNVHVAAASRGMRFNQKQRVGILLRGNALLIVYGLFSTFYMGLLTL